MKYLDYITSVINEVVSEAFLCDNKNMLGLAKGIRKTDTVSTNTKPKIVPGIYQGLGKDVNYAGFDDRYSLCSYHKAGTVSTRRLPGGYGDDLGKVVMSHNMSMVLCADIDALGMNEDQLAMTLQLSFPDSLKGDKLPQNFHIVSFTITNINLNAEQVFREEFQNVDYFLGPEHALIKCNYTVESTVNKKCFKTHCQTV